MSGGRVAIVGAGVATPAGTTLEDVWRNLCAGVATARPHDDPDLPADARVLACRTDLDPTALVSKTELRRLDRCHVLAIAAAQQAMDSAAGGRADPERCAIVCGSGFGAAATVEAQYGALRERGLRGVSPFAVPMIMSSSVAAHLSIRFGFAGPSHSVSTSCASGATAIGEGVELLRRGGADLVLAGGVDALIAHSVVSFFLRLDVMSTNTADPARASRPFDADRDGFVLGEGAGFVVLVREEDAAATDPLGIVAGYGATSDARHLVAPDEQGAGAIRCMNAALADAGLGAGDIGHVNAHGTSTRRNDAAEAVAIRSVLGDGVPVTSVKGSTGHLIGGSGAVEAVVTALSLRRGLAPPVAGFRTPDPEIGLDVVAHRPRPIDSGWAISNSFGFGGHNVSLVIGRA